MSENSQQTFRSCEKYLSQIPALQELIGLGYMYLSPQQAKNLRGGKTSNVLLEGVLGDWLKKFNRVQYKGKEYHFSEANIQEAIQKIKNIRYDGLQKTNEAIYDLITLGTVLEQTVEGDRKSFSINYIDWKIPSNNVFHVVPEFSVARNRSVETVRVDIVLFVNGIPLAVIECKSPDVEVEQAISQMIRNQGEHYIPRLFTYVQLVIATNKNAVRYATAGTAAKFWSIWRELEDKEDKIGAIINTPLSAEQKDALFSGEFSSARKFFDSLENEGERMLTEQDKVIYSLCRPERLIELSYRFTLFDGGIKKIARYQQFFIIRSIMARIRGCHQAISRASGIVWQTQGSGKSLMMVMLVRMLVLSADIVNPRIILVTDRKDLDRQLGNTFAACGLLKKRADSGRSLVTHLKSKVGIITTLIHKFQKGFISENYVDKSSNIFVLVDESHRTNYGEFAGEMRKMLPNSCYLGFTGTPLLKPKNGENSFTKFGGLIEPHYPIEQAVKDKVVLPLLYEGRHVELIQDKDAIDLWFDRHTSDLTQKQKADLKIKYARAKTLNNVNQAIYLRAFNISEHYRSNWQGTGFKAQLVAPSKSVALKYYQYFKEIGSVTSEVIISSPDTREGHKEVNEDSTDAVVRFWHEMMRRFGSEEGYTEQIINEFKYGEKPEILIVVDKLLTGFDAPKNTILYLCRAMSGHTLLQAIARVNRLYENKEFGYIVDYDNVLGRLDKALSMYDVFRDFDEEHLLDTLTSIEKEVKKLPQRHSDLWDVFREVKNKQDEEGFEVLLADDELREEFYERLAEYSNTLAIALSMEQFLMKTDEVKLQAYKNDLKRFQNLKKSVKLRYAESIDYRDHEPKIQKVLNTHVKANEVYQLNEPVNIFERKTINACKKAKGIHSTKSTAARADSIAHATKKAISEKMAQDPAFYGKFSTLIQQAIDDFKARRLSDLEYLYKVTEISDAVVAKKHDDAPECIRDNDEACAYYGVIKPYFMKYESDEALIESMSADAALSILCIIEDHWKVDFWTDHDAQKAMANKIDDFLYDEVKKKFGIVLSTPEMDEIIEKIKQIAKSRRHS